MTYTFRYFVNFGGDYGDEIEFDQEITEEQYEIIESAKEEDITRLSDIPKLSDLCEQLQAEMEEIEKECMVENGDWDDNLADEYETDNPFDIFNLIILI